MNVLTRSGPFSTNETDSRHRRSVCTSHSRKYKRRNGIYDFLGSYNKSRDSTSRNMSRRLITSKELDFYLYGRTDVLPVKMEEGSPDEETTKQKIIANKIPNYEEKSVDILQLRYKPGVEKEFRSSEEFKKVLAAIKSIPSQLHLCYSSIPGAGFGICATEIIPSGTWIGPYEGKRVSIEEIGFMLDTRCIWEIYKNGVLDHGIDGMEMQANSSWCWMKYIQCARSTTEQNTVVFQFGADIYFQTYKIIKPGEEILVWYAEYYEQYHGIPVGVRKINKTKETPQTATTTKEIIERAQRNISEITPTTDSVENPRPIKPLALYSRTMTKPPSLRSNHVSRPELPPASTRGGIPSNPSPELQPTSSSKPKKQKILSQVPKEKPSSICEPNNVGTTMTSQEKVARTKDLRLGIQNFKTRFWKCEHCLSKFPQKWALQVHTCTCVVTKPYLCSNCGKAYVSKDDLQAHASNCGGGRQYKCGYCGRSFLNVNTLSKHLKVHSRKSGVGAFKRKTMVPSYQRHVQ